MDSVRDLVAEAEARSALAPGATERFAGYALMSLPFSSGYVLGLRRFPVTSIGPGYTSVWLRTPADVWTIYTTVDATVSCPRYFGAALESTSVHRIEVEWTGERTFTVNIDDEVDLRWSVTLAATPMTRIMSRVASSLPARSWQSERFLSALGAVAGPSLRAGRIGMTGKTPNEQLFKASPRRMWIVDTSQASVRGEDLGAIEPLPRQTRLGDFWMPQRGIFMIGGAEFDPLAAGVVPPTTKAASRG
ncbi:hypothetical protein [Microbacterium sp. TWP3-1-2b2]|uniref:hypothetical protein n=1 Tax=Microbacterium sp. TWP3-1-2b2 TaxID=2804651 RepID=UPI003CFA23F7